MVTGQMVIILMLVLLPFTDIMHIDQARQGSMLIDLSVMAWKKDQRLGRVDLWVMASLLGVQEAFVMTR